MTKNRTQEGLRVILKPERDKAVRNRHPWIFSGAIDQVDEDLKKGNLVKVYSSKKEFLGVGYFNPDSQITVRVLSFEDEAIDAAFFVRRFQEAKRLRDELVSSDTNAYRLVHSEGDFLPGLVVDRHGDYLVVQFMTAGMDALKSDIVGALEEVFRPKGIYQKDDLEVRKKEKLETKPVVLAGEAPPDRVEIREYGNRFRVDLKRGQKTGFFLDQRENRKWIGDHSKGKRVLDCFSYAGAFSVYAARGGAASVTTVEEQKPPFSMIEKNFELNGLRGDQHRFICGDVFDFLRNDKETYDLIILDPPAFCKGKEHVKKAARGYKDVNLQAIKRIVPGGILFTSSCSYFIDADLFQKIVFGAAKDAGRNVQIIQKTSHAFDHPVSIYHPEGTYLKSLFVRVV